MENIRASREPSFIGDEWHCRCGNQPHTNGFYPCLPTGEYIDSAKAGWYSGDFYRCALCDVVVEFDEVADTGRIFGQAETRFLGMEVP